MRSSPSYKRRMRMPVTGTVIIIVLSRPQPSFGPSKDPWNGLDVFVGGTQGPGVSGYERWTERKVPHEPNRLRPSPSVVSTGPVRNFLPVDRGPNRQGRRENRKRVSVRRLPFRRVGVPDLEVDESVWIESTCGFG